MELVFLARHAESRFSVRGLCNGDPAACEGLTDEGRAQARALGEQLAGDAIDVCVHTEFRRTRETAELALQGRDVPFVVVPELNDIRVGEWEGASFETYRDWAWSADPEAVSPGGAESRAAVAARYAAGLRAVLERPERAALVVAHGLPVRYALEAAEGRNPSRRVAVVEYAKAHRLTGAELEAVAARLEAWSARPVFA